MNLLDNCLCNVLKYAVVHAMPCNVSDENGQISFFGTTMEPVMTPVRGNGSMSVPSYSSRCHSPTSDHSNVTYQVSEIMST